MTPALLLAAALSLVASVILGPKLPRWWLGLVLAGCAAAGSASLGPLLGGADFEWRSSFPLGGEDLHLRLDGLSALFLLMVCLIGGLGAIYSAGYWSDKYHPDSAPRGRGWWSGLLLSLGAVLVASNGLHFLIAWEAFTICAYFLITLDRRKREVRAAGWLFLAASHAGMVCLFAFFCALSVKLGTWDLGPWHDHPELAPLFWLALAGFGVKAGLFPLHIWLPSAHANAPSHVSAILSGVTLKVGIYGILRFGGWLPVPAGAGYLLIGLGAASAVLGIAFALVQNDLKRLLAYCSVENVGVIFLGVGTALLGAAQGGTLWGRLALAGALLHIWNHCLFKSLLFFGAGSVMHASGTRELSRLGGLWRRMPWTAGMFVLAAAAISGLPPLNGFVSEWLVYLGLWDTVNARGAAAWAALPALVALAVAGALAMASFAKACSTAFLGAPRTRAAREAHECGAAMRGPMLVLSALCVVVGLAPVWVWPMLNRAEGAWNPAWSAEAAAPVPLATLGAAQAALALGALAAGFGLWRIVRRRGVERGLTWDCGYVGPTARMQYTGGSFSGIAGGWFGWALRPERAVSRPRGFFPEGASHLERVPEAVLERVVAPAGAVVLRASTAVRRLQHGRLQSYILYLVAGLVAVALLAALGGFS